MDSKWKLPKIIIGSPAIGNYYYNRPQIVDEIWEKIEIGNHLLIAAPRRVGKTSIMRFIEENPKNGYKPIFKNIQSIQSEKEFYKTIYELTLTSLNKISKLKTEFNKYLKSKKIAEIDIKGVFKIEDSEIDFLSEIKKEIIPILEKHEETLILILDELPEVLYNLYKLGKNNEASGVLNNIRTWGQEKEFKKIKIITSGSVGIHHVVKKIEGRTANLNAFTKIHFSPMNKIEAINYIKWITEDASLKFNEEQIEIILEKTNYFVPYFINLIVDEVDRMARYNNPEITNETIETAFNNAIKNNSHFIDWKYRLQEYYAKDEYAFIHEILTLVSHQNVIQIQLIYNIAMKHQLQYNYMDLINEMENDGYITEIEKQNYSFISPLLKEYWKRNHPLLNENTISK